MGRVEKLLICFLLSPMLAAPAPQTTTATAQAPESLPFWKAKEKVYTRITNGEIIVSVKTVEPNLVITGGGHVRAPRDFVFEYARDFEHLDHLGIYVDKAHFDPATSMVEMTMSALGKHADFKVRVHSDVETDPRRLDFEIVEGPVKGLKGALEFYALNANKTEVGITGEYNYGDQKMLKFLLGFGLEVMFQRMAARLRDHVQAAYREQGAHS